MPECFCDYEPMEFYSRSLRRARKQQRCNECRRAIQAGEVYERVAGKSDGSVYAFKTCARCTALRDHIKAHASCFCWAHGNLLGGCRDFYDGLPAEADGTGLRFELGRLAVAIRRAPHACQLTAARGSHAQ